MNEDLKGIVVYLRKFPRRVKFVERTFNLFTLKIVSIVCETFDSEKPMYLQMATFFRSLGKTVTFSQFYFLPFKYEADEQLIAHVNVSEAGTERERNTLPQPLRLFRGCESGH